MAKFSLVIAASGLVLLFVAMAAITDATTTTINTYTFQENPSCTVPMMQQEMLSHCRMYLTTRGSQQGSPRAMMNPAKEHFDFCCMQLKNMGEECMCEGIKMMMNLPGWTQQQMGDQMVTMAQNLPKQCGFMSQQCQVRAFWF